MDRRRTLRARSITPMAGGSQPSPRASFLALPSVLAGHHVRLWLLIVLATTIVGTLGYIVLLGWGLSDAI